MTTAAATYAGQEGRLTGIDWEYWGQVLTVVTLAGAGATAAWRILKNWLGETGKAIKAVGDDYVRSVTAPQIAATKMLAEGFERLNTNVQGLSAEVKDLGGRASAIEDSQNEILVAQARAEAHMVSTEARISSLENAMSDMRADLRAQLQTTAPRGNVGTSA